MSAQRLLDGKKREVAWVEEGADVADPARRFVACLPAAMVPGFAMLWSANVAEHGRPLREEVRYDLEGIAAEQLLDVEVRDATEMVNGREQRVRHVCWWLHGLHPTPEWPA